MNRQNLETLVERSMDDLDMTYQKLDIEIREELPQAESPGTKIGKMTIERPSHDMSPAISMVNSDFQMKRINFPKTPTAMISKTQLPKHDDNQKTTLVH